VELPVKGRVLVGMGPQACQRPLLVGQQPRSAPTVAPPQPPAVSQHSQNQSNRPRGTSQRRATSHGGGRHAALPAWPAVDWRTQGDELAGLEEPPVQRARAAAAA
jgi:hypothetical protein